MWLGRHPGYAALSRFADGELAPRSHRRIASHLADCPHCRQELAFIRQAGALARSLEAPPVPPDLPERVLERRADGDRVLLPLESPGPKPGRAFGRTALPAAAAAVILFAVGLFAPADLLKADRSNLRIEPERPRAGATLAIEYDGDLEFSGQQRLRLRARYRTRTGQTSQIETTLSRDGDVYRTELVLPDSVVYAAFAVEDLDAEHVDSNNRELWDVRIHGPDGRPTLVALSEQTADLLPRNELAASQTIETMTELYPESPRGWGWLWTVESRFADEDSLRRSHLDRLRRLEQTMASEPPADPEELAHLAWYAIQLGDWASADYWTRAAERRGARCTYLYQAKAIQLQVADRLDATEKLRQLDTIWTAASTPVAVVADVGWSLALQTGDWRAATRWLERHRDVRGIRTASDILTDLDTVFGSNRTLEWALAHRDGVLLRPSQPRPLVRSKEEHDRHLAHERQRALASLADIALNAGRAAVASEIAVEALPLGWATLALETIGAVLLEVGDTADAVTAYARAAADPLAGVPPAAIEATADWAAELESARDALTRHVLQSAVIRHPTVDGQDGRVGITAFASACSGALEALDALAGRLTDVSVAVYETASPVGGGASLRTCGLKIPIEQDSTGRVGQEFRVRGFPTFFVTDALGRIRFEHSTVEEIPRQIQALQRTSVPAVAD